MSMTDPIADMLTRLRNANLAMHDDVSMPSSKLKESLATLLQREGYITGFSVAPAPKGPGNKLTITLVVKPGAGLITAEWRSRCTQIGRDLQAYLMGR